MRDHKLHKWLCTCTFWLPFMHHSPRVYSLIPFSCNRGHGQSRHPYFDGLRSCWFWSWRWMENWKTNDLLPKIINTVYLKKSFKWNKQKLRRGCTSYFLLKQRSPFPEGFFLLASDSELVTRILSSSPHLANRNSANSLLLFDLKPSSVLTSFQITNVVSLIEWLYFFRLYEVCHTLEANLKTTPFSM